MLRRWGAAFAVVAVAAATALVLGLTSPDPSPIEPALHGSPTGPGLTDIAATPNGWAPVAFGNAQISVPSDWLVSGTPQCGVRAAGYVQFRNLSRDRGVQNPQCKQPPNIVIMQVVPKGRDQAHRRTGQINGVPILGVRPTAQGLSSFLAPTLHVLVSVKGPLANEVLETLTRSPLSVVLAPGWHFPVPHSWRWHDFGGIRFAAPGDWALMRDGHYACPFGLSPNVVILVPAQNRIMPRCGIVVATAAAESAHFGITVTTGPGVSRGTAQFDGCALRNGMRQCYSAPPLRGGVLDVAVFAPGRHRVTFVEIGLAGDGVTARTIVDSIRQLS